MAKLIAICGKVAVGKTYYAVRLCQTESAVLLSCDELMLTLCGRDLGRAHDETAKRVQEYLKTKAAQIVRAGGTVIFDWGFWRKEERTALTSFCRKQEISCEWHWVTADEATHRNNIEERNRKILSGEDRQNYYLDDGLLQKCFSRWEEPDAAEMDVCYRLQRKTEA